MKLDGTLVCVAGLGVTGPSAVRALLSQGAHVVAVDGRDGDRERALAAELRRAGAEVRLGDGDTLPDGVALVVTSPGWRPHCQARRRHRSAHCRPCWPPSPASASSP